MITPTSKQANTQKQKSTNCTLSTEPTCTPYSVETSDLCRKLDFLYEKWQSSTPCPRSCSNLQGSFFETLNDASPLTPKQETRPCQDVISPLSSSSSSYSDDGPPDLFQRLYSVHSPPITPKHNYPRRRNRESHIPTPKIFSPNLALPTLQGKSTSAKKQSHQQKQLHLVEAPLTAVTNTAKSIELHEDLRVLYEVPQRSFICRYSQFKSILDKNSFRWSGTLVRRQQQRPFQGQLHKKHQVVPIIKQIPVSFDGKQPQEESQQRAQLAVTILQKAWRRHSAQLKWQRNKGHEPALWPDLANEMQVEDKEKPSKTSKEVFQAEMHGLSSSAVKKYLLELLEEAKLSPEPLHQMEFDATFFQRYWKFSKLPYISAFLKKTNMIEIMQAIAACKIQRIIRVYLSRKHFKNCHAELDKNAVQSRTGSHCRHIFGGEVGAVGAITSLSPTSVTKAGASGICQQAFSTYHSLGMRNELVVLFRRQKNKVPVSPEQRLIEDTVRKSVVPLQTPSKPQNLEREIDGDNKVWEAARCIQRAMLRAFGRGGNNCSREEVSIAVSASGSKGYASAGLSTRPDVKERRVLLSNSKDNSAVSDWSQSRKASVSLLQRVFRGYLVRRTMKSRCQSATRIASWWRMISCLAVYNQKLAHRSREEERRRFQLAQMAKEADSATVIATWWRMVLCPTKQRPRSSQIRSASFIQAIFRGFLQRQKYKVLRDAKMHSVDTLVHRSEMPTRLFMKNVAHIRSVERIKQRKEACMKIQALFLRRQSKHIPSTLQKEPLTSSSPLNTGPLRSDHAQIDLDSIYRRAFSLYSVKQRRKGTRETAMGRFQKKV